MNEPLRKIVLVVALLNLAYFGIEFGVALSIGSASLLADSADFFEDASVNLLIFFALACPVARTDGHDYGRYPCGPRARLRMDRLEQISSSCAPCCLHADIDGTGSAGSQSMLRFYASNLQTHKRQLDPRCVPVSQKRRNRKHRHHSGRDRYGLCVDVRLARPHCRIRHRIDES